MTTIESTQTLRLWSFTSIKSMALGDGYGLVNWKLERAAEAAVDKYGYLGRIIAEEGADGAKKWVAGAPRRWSSQAKARGTEIHTAAEQIALGEKVDIADHLEPYVDQYRAWLQKYEPVFLMAEAPVYNLTYRYAGTCDGIVTLGGQTVLFDIKTTDKGPDSGKRRPPFDENALQVVAYARAEEVGVLAEQRYDGGRRYYIYDPNTRHEPMPRVDGALIVVVSPFDCYAVPVALTEQLWRAWLAVYRVARFKQEADDYFRAPLYGPRD